MVVSTIGFLIAKLVSKLTRKPQMLWSIKCDIRCPFNRLTNSAIFFSDEIEFAPELPYERRILTRQIVMGCYTKFVASYETSFWREAGLSGELTRFTDCEEAVASSPVGMVMDSVTPDNNATLVGFFTGYGASHWASKKVCLFLFVVFFSSF